MKDPKARVLVVKARVLVVDDYEPWRYFISSTLQKYSEFLIVGEVSDGLAAIKKAQELQPDLVLLDIGLPTLNGIGAARQIRDLAPKSKILFITENSSWGIVRESLRTGAGGYLVKSDAARELLPAIRAVLQGKQFLGARFAGRDVSDLADERSTHTHVEQFVTPPAQTARSIGRHEVGLYSDDGSFLDHVANFVGPALKSGSAAVVVATESHRQSLAARLQDEGVDIDAAVEQGRYIAADVDCTVATFMVHGKLDRDRFLKAWGNLILAASKASKGKQSRVAVYGEGAGHLWAQGNHEAAIEIEKVCNQLTESYAVDILCGYSLASVPGGVHGAVFQPICAEHSASYSY